MKSDLPKSGRYEAYLEVQATRIDSLREELENTFPGQDEVVLEIGCGHGHYLTAYAGKHPTTPCLGIDLVTKRIRKGCLKRDKRGLEKLHFMKAEVRELLTAWPERLRLERIFILFPDPWPKKRHIKNRIIQAALLDRLAEQAQIGTALHFRTDHPGNFDYGREVIESHSAWTISDDVPWPFENPSFFQNLFTEYHSLTALRTD